MYTQPSSIGLAAKHDCLAFTLNLRHARQLCFDGVSEDCDVITDDFDIRIDGTAGKHLKSISLPSVPLFLVFGTRGKSMVASMENESCIEGEARKIRCLVVPSECSDEVRCSR